MVMAADIKRKICSLFEVKDDEKHVQRVITPMEYPSTGDHVVVRVRPREDGTYQIDEAGEAALYASMAGGDTDCDTVHRWHEDTHGSSPVRFEDDMLYAIAPSQEFVAPYIFRVAEAAQQLFAIATSRATRNASDFKQRLCEVFEAAAKEFDFTYEADVELPIAGGLYADFVVSDADRPLIVVAANSLPRLLEAEIIHMQYQLSKRPGFVLAVAESQAAVGKKQFERANYYTDKTVSFNPTDLRQFLAHTLALPN